MSFKVSPTKIPEVLLIEPKVHRDNRGHFLETYHRERYREHGIQDNFVQDNFSFSVKNTLRGLHYQLNNPQAKLVMALRGDIFDVAVDIRVNSPSFGQWVGVHLSGETGNQLYIPAGFAHGFCVLSPEAEVHYKCSDFYDADDDFGLLWSDEKIGIDWPVKKPLLSSKDQQHPECETLKMQKRLPIF